MTRQEPPQRADIAAQRQAHGTQCKEACNGGQAGSGDGGHGLADGAGHGLFVRGAQLLFFLIAVQQEDGEVHRDTQLQHGGQCFGDVADLAQEDAYKKQAYFNYIHLIICFQVTFLHLQA